MSKNKKQSDYQRSFSSGFVGSEQKQKLDKNYKSPTQRRNERLAKMSASQKAERARKIAKELKKNKKNVNDPTKY